MKQYKAVTTGRVYNFNQVLYSSIEKTGADEFGAIYQIIIIDPSRNLSYLYHDIYSFSENKTYYASDILKQYDGGGGQFISDSDERYQAIIKHFKLKEG